MKEAPFKVDHSGTVIESQVDYLTVSAHGHDRASNLLDLAHAIAKGEKAKRNRERRWRLMGYEGTHVGACEYGSRDTSSAILRLSGNLAAERMLHVLSAADQVTRCDIAVTWRAEPPDPYHGKIALAQAEEWYELHPKAALPWAVHDASGGFTLYVGKRRSENMLRVYNKEAESRDEGDDELVRRYRSCWRYELETKGTVAGRLADVVLNHDDPPGFVQGYIHAYAMAHGITPPFPWTATERSSLASVAVLMRIPNLGT